jgi:hypothetical protein
MAQLHFDASKVEPDNGIEVVPAGWYNAAIDESGNKPTKDGVNSYTQFRFTILDGQYKGRKLFARFNLQHTNAQTSEIAQRQLSALCHAAGVLQLSDTQQLHNIPMKVKAIVKKDEGYEPSNELRSFKNINEVVEGSAPAGAPAASAPPAAQLPPAQPWAQQTQSAPPAAPPAAPPVAPPAAAFPPAGWTAHPSAPGYYYAGNEVLSEADLRARFPAQPAAPAAPPAPPAAPAAPPAQGGWQQPAGQQPWGQPGGAAPGAPPAAAGAPAAPEAPHPAQGFAPPWTQKPGG